jgi:ferredoxin-thioredoxin reductase catalytic chain
VPTKDTDQDKMAAALERVTRMVNAYARKSGLRVQPDEALRRHVLQGLARNLVLHGRAYCPCREVTGEAERDRANICPCRTHMAEIDETGECECGIFVAGAQTTAP